MKQYQLNKQPIQPSYTLEVINNAYDTLEQKHLMSVQQAAETKSAIAEMDFNEEEEWYRQKMINDIDEAIDDNTIYGNAAGALDDIIRTIGDINSNPQTIGRLKAQKDFKAFEKELNETTEIPEYMKDMYREQNKYYYSDKVDEKTGKVVGYTKWEPNKRWVQHIDQKVAIEDAIKYASPESGSWSSVRYLDANGEVSDTYSPDGSIELFDTTTGRYERLSKEKLQQGYDAAIAANPALRASLKQEYETALWGYNNGKFTDTNLLKLNGVVKTFEEYCATSVDKFKEAKSYYNKFITRNPNMNLFKESKSTNRKGVNVYSTYANNLTGQVGDPVEMRDNSNLEYAARAQNAKGEKALAIRGVFKNLDFKGVDINDRDAVNKYLKDNKIGDEQIEALNTKLDAIDEINADAYAAMDKIEKENPRYASAVKIQSAIENGQYIDYDDIEDPDLKEDLINHRDRLYNGAKDLRIPFNTDNAYEYLMTYFSKYLDNGKAKIVKIDNNNAYVEIPAGLNTAAFEVYGSVQEAYKGLQSGDKFTAFMRRSKSIIGDVGVQRVYIDSETGEERIENITPAEVRGIHNAGKTDFGAFWNSIVVPTDYISYLKDVSPYETFYSVGDILSRVRSENESIPENESYVANTITYGGASAAASAALNSGAGYIDSKWRKEIEAQVKAADEYIKRNLPNIGLSQYNVKIYKDDKFTPANQDDKENIQTALQNSNNEVSVTLEREPGKFLYKIHINKKGTNNSDGELLYNLLLDNFNDPHLDILNAYSGINGEKPVYRALATNGNKLTIGNIGGTPYSIQSVNGNFYLYNRNIKALVNENGNLIPVSKTTAINIQSIKESLNTLVPAILKYSTDMKNPNPSHSELLNILYDRYTNAVKTIFGEDKSQVVISNDFNALVNTYVEANKTINQ